MKPRPMQPIFLDNGIPRFKGNAIVRYLLDAGPFDMNTLGVMTFSAEDREQFAQLIGYSVSGFGDLSYVNRDAVEIADFKASKLLKDTA